MALPYPGLNPSNVVRDAKYRVVTGPAGRMVVERLFTVAEGERELLTTEHHDELVEKVNRVKREVSGQPGGTFYINEYFDVLVPSLSGQGCFYAGNYERLLQFDFEGTVLSPHAPPDLRPGEPWLGPHVGIKYTLAAGGKDIYYRKMITHTREKHVRLSHVHGERRAAELAYRLAAVKGSDGGAIYINEVGEFFAPINTGAGLSYVYLGPLDDAAWFPEPDVPRE